MEITIGVLLLLVALLALHTVLLHRELRSMNQQLNKRLTGDSRQPVRIELINRELSRLTENINKSLKAEETLRLISIREEKKFKELIADISHDLRTPLTAIKGYQQLLDKDELMPKQRKKLQVAMRHADELEILINHFFEYSYFLNAEVKMKPEQINLTNLVTECIAAFVPEIEKHGFMIKINETTPVYALADQEMTLRIVQNLIRNCEAHSAGDVEVQITASDRAVLSFTNPVEKASEIDVNRIFERFYNGHMSTRKTTGLGLSIVNVLTEQMGGSASAHLQGNELTIQVELPRY